jgi:hypothetical protein
MNRYNNKLRKGGQVSRFYRLKIDVLVSPGDDGIADIHDVMRRISIPGNDVMSFSVKKMYVLPEDAALVKKSMTLEKIKDLMSSLKEKPLKKDLVDLIIRIKGAINES